MTTKKFQRTILSWYRQNRRNLPWRTPVRWSGVRPLSGRKLPASLTPYHILVSEIMLQQTQTPRVLVKYPLFLKSFPEIESLARAKTEKLFSVWQGMGYWRRAFYLRSCAKEIAKTYGGAIPADPKTLQALPGIGPYTSRAVACFAFQRSEAFVDTNIRRVFIHFFFPGKKDVSDTEVLAVAQKNMWKENPREWHYALMDYGSIILGKKHELNKQSKHFHKQSQFEGSFRSFRSAVVSLLLHEGPQSTEAITAHLESMPSYESSGFPCEDILQALCKDNIIERKKNLNQLR